MSWIWGQHHAAHVAFDYAQEIASDIPCSDNYHNYM